MTIYIVQYNDCYGNGNKSFEGYVTSKKEFKQWLKVHNKKRKEEGACKESEEEFDLIPLTKL